MAKIRTHVLALFTVLAICGAPQGAQAAVPTWTEPGPLTHHTSGSEEGENNPSITATGGPHAPGDVVSFTVSNPALAGQTVEIQIINSDTGKEGQVVQVVLDGAGQGTGTFTPGTMGTYQLTGAGSAGCLVLVL